MLITLSTNTADLQGYVELDVASDSDSSGASRRVSRIATLDGGAVLNDGGFSDSDRTLDLVWRRSYALTDVLVRRLVQLYSVVQVSMADGVYVAALENYQARAEESSLRLLVLSRLSA